MALPAPCLAQNDGCRAISRARHFPAQICRRKAFPHYSVLQQFKQLPTESNGGNLWAKRDAAPAKPGGLGLADGKSKNDKDRPCFLIHMNLFLYFCP
jgi:hypothetical protein